MLAIRVCVPSACHAELVSASYCVGAVMPNLFRHLETLKRVQGDGLEGKTLKQVQGDGGVQECWQCVCAPSTCHAELVSASLETLKQVQGDGLEEKTLKRVQGDGGGGESRR